EVEFAKTIHLSGNDLLMLINDILDLSKIESGTVAVDVSELRLDDLQRSVDRSFRHVAESKHVDFVINTVQPLPKTVVTDAKRLQQVIKNLLSNAFKFTQQGQVRLTMDPVQGGWNAENEDLNRASQVLAIAVSDTGIGISPDKQQIIFEAFQQADGSTSRKYGGTGLGLAISRELSRLLGGEIRLVSSPGEGSTFTLYLPQSYSPARSARHGRSVHEVEAKANAERQRDAQREEAHRPPKPTDSVPIDMPGKAAAHEPEPIALGVNVADDDRNEILSGEKVLLIVENDVGFAKVLLEAARKNGFKGLVSTTGAGALALTREYQPSVITLDIFLPDMEGWRILERLKGDLATRHIPICVVSTDDSRQRALNSGAIGFLTKPLQSVDVVDEALAHLYQFADRSAKKLLVLMSNSPLRDEYLACLDGETQIVLANSAQAARTLLSEGGIDCLVTDGKVPGFGPEDVIETQEGRPLFRQLPIVLFCDEAGALGAEWKRGHSAFALREAHTLERLLDATAFF